MASKFEQSVESFLTGNSHITRRDFVHGLGVGLAGAALGAEWACVAPRGVGSSPSLPSAGVSTYPPGVTGLRGAHKGSWETAHALRRGNKWGLGRSNGETYDLVVVGAGISGLAAAYYYRQKFKDARILILDNHDDFGGHCKRIEFEHQGHRAIGYGGCQSIEAPSAYSARSKGLLEELGMDVQRFYTAFDQNLYPSHGMSAAYYARSEAFGHDALVRDIGDNASLVASLPLSEHARAELLGIMQPGAAEAALSTVPVQERRELLARISYDAFLDEYLSVGQEVRAFLADKPRDYWAVGSATLSALAAMEEGYPGFVGAGVPVEESSRQSADRPSAKTAEPYIFHFPDGNGAITRMLVRALCPHAAPGHSMEDIVTARFDYNQLDATGAAVRIRLNSTVVHVGNATDGDVDIAYVGKGEDEAVSVKAGACVLACWHRMIPYICPEVPEAQKKALSYGAKLPIVYAEVFTRQWTAWKNLGIHTVHVPGGYFTDIALDYPVSLGEYHFSENPQQPVVVHMVRAPSPVDCEPHKAFSKGRFDIMRTSFSTFEHHIRSQLQRILGPGGFSADDDIWGITVNRWPHGYSYEYAYAGEPAWTDETKPCRVARQPLGHIAIACSDGAGTAFADAAIDEAYRAVNELAPGVSEQRALARSL